MSLSAFLMENVEKIEVMEYVASKRFKEDGKPVAWKIKAISSERDEEIRKACTQQVPIPGMKGQFSRRVDTDKYLGKMVTECVLYPDLNNAELQNSYGVMGSDALLKKMLLPGEYADLLEKVQEVNGYETMSDLVEEAKN